MVLRWDLRGANKHMSSLGPRLAGREGERDWRQNITSAVATSNLKYRSEEGRQIAFRRWGTARGPERRQHVPFLTSEIGTCHDDQRLLNIAAIAPRRRQTCYRGLLFSTSINGFGVYQIFSLDRFIILHSLLSKPRVITIDVTKFLLNSKAPELSNF